MLDEAVNITRCGCKRIKSSCHRPIFAESVQRTSSDTPIRSHRLWGWLLLGQHTTVAALAAVLTVIAASTGSMLGAKSRNPQS